MDEYGGRDPLDIPEAPRPPRGTPPLPGREIRRVFNRVGWGLFLYLLTSWASLLLGTAVAMQYFPAVLRTPWFFQAGDFVAQYLIALPVTLLLWSTIPDRATPPARRQRVTPGGFCLLVPACFAGTIALNKLSATLAGFLARLKGSEVTNPLDSFMEEGSPWLAFFMLVVAAPLAEELLFRKLLYKKLSCFGGRVYILSSSVLFAAMHANLFQMLYAFALGVVFASVMYYTGSVKVPVALHVLVNLLGGSLTMLLERYAPEHIFDAWSVFLAFLLLLGIVIIVLRGLYACREWLPYESPRLARGTAAVINPGMLLFVLTTASLTVYYILM